MRWAIAHNQPDLSALAGYLLLSPEDGAAAGQRAAQFYDAIESLSKGSGIVLGPFYQALNRQRIARARQHLAEQDLRNALEQGRQWNKEAALEQARKLLEL